MKAAVDRRLAALSTRVAEMHALKAATEPQASEEVPLQSKLDTAQFRLQRSLALLREGRARERKMPRP